MESSADSGSPPLAAEAPFNTGSCCRSGGVAQVSCTGRPTPPASEQSSAGLGTVRFAGLQMGLSTDPTQPRSLRSPFLKQRVRASFAESTSEEPPADWLPEEERPLTPPWTGVGTSWHPPHLSAGVGEGAVGVVAAPPPPSVMNWCPSH